MWSHMVLGILYISLKRGLKLTPNSHMPWCPPSSFWALDTIFPPPPSSCCSLSSEQGGNLYVCLQPLGHELNCLWCGALHPHHHSNNATPGQLTTQLTHSQFVIVHGTTTTTNLIEGPLHARAKPCDHEIVRAQKQVSKGRCPNTPPTSCTACGHGPSSVVWCHMWPGPAPNAISMNVYSNGSHTWESRINQRLWAFEEEAYSPFRKRCPLRRPRHLIRVRVRVGSSPGDHRSRIGRKTHVGALSHTFTNFRGMLEGTFSFECHGLPMVFC